MGNSGNVTGKAAGRVLGWALRCEAAGSRAALLLIVCALALVLPRAGQAAPSGDRWSGNPAGAAAVRVIRNDPGGRIKPRFEEVRRMRMTGTRVEIRGSYCLSACTLYLGAGNVCVSPATRFGFHGPSYMNRQISGDRFDYWSQRMAALYPPGVARWFLTQARHVTRGYLTLTGAELIRMGVRRC